MQPQNNQATDQTANLFWLLTLITIALVLVWWFGRAPVLHVLFFIRHYEILLIQVFVAGINGLTNLFYAPLLNTHHLILWDHFMSIVPLKQVSFEEMTAISRSVGDWLCWPVALILLELARRLYFHSKNLRFRHVHSMPTLRKVGAQVWPQILPAIASGASTKNLDEGPWAMAQLPLDYCKEHHLLLVEEDSEGRKKWTLKKPETERVFALQMGAVWSGAENLPHHIQALFVIFVAQIERDFSVKDTLIEQISNSVRHQTLDFRGVSELASKYKDAEVVRWVEQRHAYLGTVMPTLLEIARMNGVLASAEFLWLKPVDRPLWYSLNAVGRPTCVVEIAALFGHRLAERAVGHRLRTPTYQTAVTALAAEIDNILYTETAGSVWDTRRVD